MRETCLGFYLAACPGQANKIARGKHRHGNEKPRATGSHFNCETASSLQAVAATVSLSSSIMRSRMTNFCTLPVTVIGISVTKRM
ncbi:hypothetical protein R16034_02322 [Ralstonia edaphis]|uniref:Uncharacterized protein n=1 Tax=Ralstonia edaphi TaxID=3058599 RepID=A0AB72X0D2_9RALS|nr:hypothetical protein LMG6871_04626 [Ralstonia sp. LMG 6871]CAJ0740811.1 hypothetical protein R16034_02322 [Ralstonia sp. LMG 6871]